MKNEAFNKANIHEAQNILLDIQYILCWQLHLPPFEELRKAIKVVEQENTKQFHLVDRWLFELLRGFYDTGCLRGVPEEERNSLFTKIEKEQNLLKEVSTQ